MLGHLESQDFLKVLQDDLLNQVVREPNRGAKILDLVLTNNGNMMREVEGGTN